jgi:hypothetical protein
MSRAKDDRATLRAETAQLLEDLGPTVEGVAVKFKAAGAKGIPHSRTGCVVARYLNAVMGSDPRLGRVTVSSDAVNILGRHWWSFPLIVPVPPPVRSFTARFIAADFRDLVAPPPSSHRITTQGAVDPASVE